VVTVGFLVVCSAQPAARAGTACSSASATQRRNRIASAPSITAVVVRQRQRQHEPRRELAGFLLIDRLHAGARDAEEATSGALTIGVK